MLFVVICAHIIKRQEIRILEQFQCPKSNLSQCEDKLIICEDYIAVADGATAKGSLQWDGMTSGYRAVEIICEVIHNLPPDTTINDFIVAANVAICEYYDRFSRLQEVYNKKEERLTASVVLYNKNRKEIWMIGDCLFRINERSYRNDKLIDDKLARVRSEIDSYLLNHGYTIDLLQKTDVGRLFISKALKEQQYFQNDKNACEYSYGVIDGFDVEMSQTICVDVPEFSEMVLASDGYPKLFGTLEESEHYLQKVLAEDPLCISLNKQTKGLMVGNNSYDDRTFVRFVS